MDDDLLASIEFRELVRRADRGVMLKHFPKNFVFVKK